MDRISVPLRLPHPFLDEVTTKTAYGAGLKFLKQHVRDLGSEQRLHYLDLEENMRSKHLLELLRFQHMIAVCLRSLCKKLLSNRLLDVGLGLRLLLNVARFQVFEYGRLELVRILGGF